MGSYTSPSASAMRARIRVSPDVEEISSSDLDGALLALRPDAETETALQVTEALFDSAELTDRQVVALQTAVSLRAGAEYLRGIATERVTGTNAPLLMETAREIREQADALEQRAATFDLLAKGEAAEEAAAPPGPRVTRRARIGVITVDPYSLTVRPSERIELGDERDDLPAGTVLVRDGAGVL